MSNIKNVLAERNDLREEVTLYKAYLKYVRAWYRENTTAKEQGAEPEDFQKFVERYNQKAVYVIEVDMLESSHIVCEYDHVIEVTAPIGLTVDQLKEYIKTESPYPIEDLIDAKVDAPDAVILEIHDFDITLIEVKSKEVSHGNS